MEQIADDVRDLHPIQPDDRQNRSELDHHGENIVFESNGPAREEEVRGG
jgi:hypothetical protein